jgi:hypothetical protein
MKHDSKDILAYIQGNVRYKLYYSWFKFLIRKHIKEQIVIRINSMEPKCYLEGSCVMCGCKTTALQMANKACDRPCYPRMLNTLEWHGIRYGKELWLDRENNMLWHVDESEQFTKIKLGRYEMDHFL